MENVDVAIIGAGTAGLAAYRAVRAAGRSALVIDHGPLGTTCARVGCMPSKLLLQAAHAAQAARDAGIFGIGVSEVRVDAAAVFARVREERDRFVRSVKEGMSGVEVRDGTAQLTAADTLSVNGQLLGANAVVIATGSTPVVPAPLRGLPILTTDTIFELSAMPRQLAVIGAGPIALELGQAMAQLGAEVTLFANDEKIAFITDPVVRASAVAHLGLTLKLNQSLVSARHDGDAFTLQSREGERRFDAVLVAAGRSPNLDTLALDRAGLDHKNLGLDPRTMRCGESRIFLAGDAAADRPVLHEAASEGHIAGENAARYPDTRAMRRHVPLSILFTSPQIAAVGARFGDLDAPLVGEVDFADQGRARVMGQNRGVARLYADKRSGLLLGAELVGPEVEHLAHLLAWAISLALKVDELLAMPFYHPVLEEGLRTALKHLAGQRVTTGCDLDCGPGT
jgi:dihydrolipoamide dehydrogenase